jgi:hypothetical protein
MKKLLTLVLIGALVLSALPIATFAFVQPGPEFCLKINGSFTPLVLKGIQYCTTFDVSVIALEFEDLYAYEWNVTWNDQYFSLVDHEVKHIHSADFVLVEEVLDTDGNGLDDTYHQAVTAVAPAEGFTGTAAMANLQFHVDNDVQWTGAGIYTQVFFIVGIGDADPSVATKAVDSCTEDIPHSDQGSWVEFRPVQPTIKMLPPVTYKSVVDETFEVQFEIQDIVKMKSFHLWIYYDDTQLTTDAQNVWIKDFLPPPYEVAKILFTYHVQGYIGIIELEVQIPCEKSCINGTGELFGIRFTTLNPWNDHNSKTVDIPPYHVYDSVEIPHPIWYPEPCWNYINIYGFIDKVDNHIQNLGALDGVRVKGPNVNPLNPPTYTLNGKTADKFIYSDGVTSYKCPDWGNAYIIGYYEFRPIPGDLDLDGHADIIDLSAMAKYYGRFSTDGLPDPPYPAWAKIKGFDLNGDLIIDVYDVVIVAKNICRTEPDPALPWPILDP